MRFRCLLVLFAAVPVAVATSTAAAESANAPSPVPSSALYKCEPSDLNAGTPPPAPPLPSGATSSVDAAIASDHFTQVCPTGDVPDPAATAGMPKASPKEALAAQRRAPAGGRHSSHDKGRIARQEHNGAWYSYALGVQRFGAGANVTGEFVEQTNEQPFVDYRKTGETDAHSLSQLWASAKYEPGKYSDVEEGWSESWGQFGDVNPHLFIYAVDGDVSLGYVGQSSIPWVQYSTVAYPNMTLTHNDTWHTYGAELNSYGWWFYYDGQWVGYIPVAAWTRFYPAWLNEIEAGGEVATPEYETCTDMGHNGEYGHEGEAAMFKDVWYVANGTSTRAALSNFTSDFHQYDDGNWGEGQPGPVFRYGGPGWCSP